MDILKTQVAIIGSGFGGLAMAIRLLQANIHDFIILEKADDVGGTCNVDFDCIRAGFVVPSPDL